MQHCSAGHLQGNVDLKQTVRKLPCKSRGSGAPEADLQGKASNLASGGEGMSQRSTKKAVKPATMKAGMAATKAMDSSLARRIWSNCNMAASVSTFSFCTYAATCLRDALLVGRVILCLDTKSQQGPLIQRPSLRALKCKIGRLDRP